MALEDKIKDSKLSLNGNGFNPTPREVNWGYSNPDIPAGGAISKLNPKFSVLHNTYDINSKPSEITIVDFNKTAYQASLPKESALDELDTQDPNIQLKVTGVVSKVYKSAKGKTYGENLPAGGRFKYNG
jgi:hypothetical protein